MKKYFFILMFACAISNGQNSNFLYHNEVNIKIINNLNIERVDDLVTIDLNQLKKVNSKFNKDAFIVYSDNVEIPSQIYSDGSNSFIVFTCNFEPNEVKQLTIKYLMQGVLRHEYQNRTYAELAMKFDAVYENKKFIGDRFQNYTKVVVPQIHTDHDALFKYEGPGWESEKVGYRFYLDWRNATDIFGKKVNELVLNKVGINDVVAKDDSYHEMQEWGMDIFKVGKSLGIGSIGMMNNNIIEMVSNTEQVKCEISSNGPIISEVKTDYDGWKIGENKYNLSSRQSISAGSRLTNVSLCISKDATNITTGLAKHDNTEFLKSKNKANWQYIALYGKQSLVDDNVGIVLFYDKSNLIEQGEDNLNYFVKLKPNVGKVEYKFAAAWEQEPDGITNIEQFKDYINDQLQKLNNKLEIAFE